VKLETGTNLPTRKDNMFGENGELVACWALTGTEPSTSRLHNEVYVTVVHTLRPSNIGVFLEVGIQLTTWPFSRRHSFLHPRSDHRLRSQVHHAWPILNLYKNYYGQTLKYINVINIMQSVNTRQAQCDFTHRITTAKTTSHNEYYKQDAHIIHALSIESIRECNDNEMVMELE